MQFEWGRDKAARNKRKHGVSFEEAMSVWSDTRRIEMFDADHSDDGECRSIAVGFSDRLRLLFVVFTERHENIRLISARRANRAESERYFATGA
jgi:uncharacterized DUF497 family protein